MDHVYLDNHATTRCDDRVLEAMLPFFREHYANPGSATHEMGCAAADAVEAARASIAQSLGCHASEIVLTSGATESNYLALSGIAQRKKRGRIITQVTEHPSVLAALQRLENLGFEIVRLPVAPFDSPLAGQIDIDQLERELDERTILVSIMWANNEIGTVQPMREIAALCATAGVPLHTDATQAVGKLEIDLSQTPVSMMSFTAHKFHGPKGCGALVVRGGSEGVRLMPPMPGGGQERGRRGGTLNVPGVVGMAAALALAEVHRAEEAIRLGKLRNRFFERLREGMPSLALNGPALQDTPTPCWQRLPQNLNIQFPGLDGHTLMVSTPEICLSSGSACTATQTEPSHVLQALGLNPDAIRSSLRFGLSRFTTEAELDFAADRLLESCQKWLRRN